METPLCEWCEQPSSKNNDVYAFTKPNSGEIYNLHKGCCQEFYQHPQQRMFAPKTGVDTTSNDQLYSGPQIGMLGDGDTSTNANSFDSQDALLPKKTKGDGMIDGPLNAADPDGRYLPKNAGGWFPPRKTKWQEIAQEKEDGTEDSHMWPRFIEFNDDGTDEIHPINMDENNFHGPEQQLGINPHVNNHIEASHNRVIRQGSNFWDESTHGELDHYTRVHDLQSNSSVPIDERQTGVWRQRHQDEHNSGKWEHDPEDLSVHKPGDTKIAEVAPRSRMQNLPQGEDQTLEHLHRDHLLNDEQIGQVSSWLWENPDLVENDPSAFADKVHEIFHVHPKDVDFPAEESTHNHIRPTDEYGREPFGDQLSSRKRFAQVENPCPQCGQENDNSIGALCAACDKGHYNLKHPDANEPFLGYKKEAIWPQKKIEIPEHLKPSTMDLEYHPTLPPRPSYQPEVNKCYSCGKNFKLHYPLSSQLPNECTDCLLDRIIDPHSEGKYSTVIRQGVSAEAYSGDSLFDYSPTDEDNLTDIDGNPNEPDYQEDEQNKAMQDYMMQEEMQQQEQPQGQSSMQPQTQQQGETSKQPQMQPQTHQPRTNPMMPEQMQSQVSGSVLKNGYTLISGDKQIDGLNDTLLFF